MPLQSGSIMTGTDKILTAALLLVLGVAMITLVMLTSAAPAHAPQHKDLPEWDKIPVKMYRDSVVQA